jgi:phenylpropionate dioxygenase-like ring-hydroxylating dioxygenase large terminal subunit
VPLSEGRIENDGTLLCSYHAWRFNGEGELVDAPQLDPDTSSLKRIQSNPKSQCNSFPTQVVDGLLYVWPEAGEDARLESALKPVKSYAMQDIDEDRMWYGPWNFRELPYGADYFIENVVDSAHVQVSHHNVVGSRYADQRMTMKTVKEVSKEGFAIQNFSPVVGGNNTAITTFHAPNLVAIETSFGTARQTLELHVSPSRPGFS